VSGKHISGKLFQADSENVYSEILVEKDKRPNCAKENLGGRVKYHQQRSQL
jgi:hypothetical protein